MAELLFEPAPIFADRRDAGGVLSAALEYFFAVGSHFGSFGQLDDEAVVRLLDENRRAA